MSKRSRVFYVLYEDEDGDDQATLIYAPSERIARAVMSRYVVIDIVAVDDPEFDLGLLNDTNIQMEGE